MASIIDNSVITCDDIIDAGVKSYHEETKPVPTSFNEKNMTCKTQNTYVLHAFLLITITLLIAVSTFI